MGFRHPGPLFGGAALMVVVTAIPLLISLILQLHFVVPGTQPSLSTMIWVSIFPMLINLLLVPLQAGYLRLVDAAECNLPARALDIFKPYLKGEALRFMGYGLVIMALYFALFALVGVAMGGSLTAWRSQVMMAQLGHQPPPMMLPSGFLIMMPIFMVFGLFMLGFFAISLGQLALSKRSVFGAIGDGAIGALKNLLPLFMFMLALAIGWVITIFCVGIVVFLFAVFAKLIGAWLIALLIVPIYIAFLIILFTSMYGVMYHIWCDVCCEDTTRGPSQQVAA
ncbi:hypothetical protein [Dyella sp. 2HG41-7]|uniref:hypothetical protein n=1 Tax=Dyella sp. 2HG41-7 TaxID=2883239 RepID=UPI001F364122|nr:hypothetical protein [Dyella sp. 2HG41-7]